MWMASIFFLQARRITGNGWNKLIPLKNVFKKSDLKWRVIRQIDNEKILKMLPGLYRATFLIISMICLSISQYRK